MNPKVSILIPAYNVEPYLRKCMDSVVNQTLKEIQIICVNDGSKDNTLEILKEYASRDSRILVIDKENGGYGVGMNIATSHATGEYIGIVEPDDYVDVNMFEKLYETAHANNLDFVKSDFYRFAADENGEVQFTLYPLTKDDSKYNILLNPSEMPECMKFTMNTWCGIYKKSFLDEYKIKYHETPGAAFQDNGFWFQTFAYAKRAMIVNTPFYYNRRDNPNSSVKDVSKVYAINIEYDYIRELFVDKPEVWNVVKYHYWFKRYHSCRFTISRISVDRKFEYVQRFAKEMKRAKETGHVSSDVFTARELQLIDKLIKDPEDYLYSEFLVSDKTKKRIEKLENELINIKKSKSYRVGLALTYIPRKIKARLRRR